MKLLFVSLGCDKNLVDSEYMLGMLEKAGIEITDDENDADIIVVNTCCFINDAKEESVNTILEMAQLKTEGKCKALLVTGCLAERYREEIETEIPEVDAYFGKFDWKGILAELGKSYDEKLRNERHLTTPKHYAYLKISEGCNRGCSYCAIPIMTGEYKSRPFEEIVDEQNGWPNRG